MCSKNQGRYIKNKGNRLDDLRDNNPRKFHRIFKRKKCTTSQLTTDGLFLYFKDVYNDYKTSEPNPTSDSLVTEEQVFLELDSYISDDEVASVLNRLKCGKATGLCNLMNEYFVKFKDIFSGIVGTPI